MLPLERPSPRHRDMSDRLAAVLTRCGVQVKEVAFWWSCSHQYVSMVLDGQKPLTDEKVELLREDVRQELAREWCADLGLLTGSRAAAIGALEAARYLLLTDIPIRMATATVDAEPAPQEQQTRRRA